MGNDNTDRLTDELMALVNSLPPTKPVQRAGNDAFMSLVDYWDRWTANTFRAFPTLRTDNDRTKSVYDFEEI